MTERRTPKAGLKTTEPELVEEPTEDLEPAEDEELADEESLEETEDEAVEGEPEEEGEETEEEEEAEEEEERAGKRRAAAGAGFLGTRRLLGRGRVSGEDEAGTRVGTSIRAITPESRVRITDRVSAVYAIVAAASLIGVLLFSLTFAPGGFFAPSRTQPPRVTFVPTFQIVTPAASGPTAQPSPSESPAGSPSTPPSPTASAS